MTSAHLNRLFLLFTTFLYISLVNGGPIGPHQQNRHVVDELPVKRDSQAVNDGGAFFSILGVRGLGDSSIHPRLEIRELEKNADQWNVYLLGLNRFQQMNQTDKLSYYQIAGIHGRPFIPWDGAAQAPGGGGGYCTHSSNLFPTWHRPFLALFEEILYLNARAAVAEFPAGDLKDRYTAAVSTLRMPYWDWAMVPPEGEGSMPYSLQQPFVDVIMPKGSTTINNPLYSYTFHPLSHNDLYDPDAPEFSTWPSTMRDPSSYDKTGVSQNDLVANEMDGLRVNLQSRLYAVFTMTTGYLNMSNDLTSGDSLEAVHDTVHNTVGSGGHMTDVPFSAFDPIFWLHHSMVDRCFALWQALYPDEYVVPMAQYYTTFAIESGTVEDVNSPLIPFHKDDTGHFWTSSDVRSTQTFGYTYSELVGLDDKNTSALRATINNLYGSTALSGGMGKRAVGVETISGAPSFSSGRQYTTNIKVVKYGLNGSFSVYIFLGNQSSADPSSWWKDSSFIGVSGAFASASPPSKANGMSHGTVPLTAALEAYHASGELQDLNEDTVSSYLKENLQWRVKSASNNTEIPIESVPGLQVAVLWSEVQPAASKSDFPKMIGDYHVLTEATEGRCGGFQPGDQL